MLVTPKPPSVPPVEPSLNHNSGEEPEKKKRAERINIKTNKSNRKTKKLLLLTTVAGVCIAFGVALRELSQKNTELVQKVLQLK